MKKSGARIIVLRCSDDFVIPILRQAHDYGLITKGYQWITMGGTIAVTPGQEHWLNGIIGTKLAIPTHNQEYQKMIARYKVMFPLNATDVLQKQHNVYIYDSVWALAHALQKMKEKGMEVVPQNISNCLDGETWRSGVNLTQVLRLQTNFVGASGIVQFDGNGDGKGIFEIVNFQNNTLVTLGLFQNGSLEMNPSGNPVFCGNSTQKPSDFDNLQGRDAIVLLSPTDPFVRIDKTKQGNDRYTGLAIELFNRIAKNLTISFKFQEDLDTSFDTQIEKIANGTADIGINAYAINSAREKLVDFTQPYFDTGLIVVILAPLEITTPVKDGGILKYSKGLIDDFITLFQPLTHPFSWEMWASILFCVLIGGLMLWSSETFHKTGEAPNVKDPQLGYHSWWTIQAILGQQPFVPRGAFGKALAFALGFYCLILVASYTAILTTNLTSSQTQPTISGYNDLKGKNIAVVRNGNVHRYIREYPPGVVSLILVADYIEIHQVLLNGTADAAVCSKAQIQTTLNEDCKLMPVGQLFNPTGVGFALNTNFPMITSAFDKLILDYEESGWIKNLTHHLFGESKCDSTKSNQTHLINFIGLYIIMGSIQFFIIVGWCISRICTRRKKGKNSNAVERDTNSDEDKDYNPQEECEKLFKDCKK